MLTPQQVTNAFLVHGFCLNNDGSLTAGLMERLDEAMRLLRRQANPTLILSGWYLLNHPELAKYCEAVAMERYVRGMFGHQNWTKSLMILQEPDSTTIPENILFTRHRFPFLNELTIITGKKLIPRVSFFVEHVFPSKTQVLLHACSDDIGDSEVELRLLGDAKCTLRSNELQVTGRTEDGRLSSNWNELRLEHHKCPYWRRRHPDTMA